MTDFESLLRHQPFNRTQSGADALTPKVGAVVAGGLAVQLHTGYRRGLPGLGRADLSLVIRRMAV
jgi:hypothetical protein